jgi:flagellar motor protein MotB
MALSNEAKQALTAAIGRDTYAKEVIDRLPLVTIQGAITAPTGGATTDAEARTAINAIITVLETAGLVAAN